MQKAEAHSQKTSEGTSYLKRKHRTVSRILTAGSDKDQLKPTAIPLRRRQAKSLQNGHLPTRHNGSIGRIIPVEVREVDTYGPIPPRSDQNVSLLRPADRHASARRALRGPRSAHAPWTPFATALGPELEPFGRQKGH